MNIASCALAPLVNTISLRLGITCLYLSCCCWWSFPRAYEHHLQTISFSLKNNVLINGKSSYTQTKNHSLVCFCTFCHESPTVLINRTCLQWKFPSRVSSSVANRISLRSSLSEITCWSTQVHAVGEDTFACSIMHHWQIISQNSKQFLEFIWRPVNRIGSPQDEWRIQTSFWTSSCKKLVHCCGPDTVNSKHDQVKTVNGIGKQDLSTQHSPAVVRVHSGGQAVTFLATNAPPQNRSRIYPTLTPSWLHIC